MSMGRISKRKTADMKEQAVGCIKGYKAGIYARLSSDQNEKKNESIDVQIEIARGFVENWNQCHMDKIAIVGCYADLGRTGTNFNRSEFQRMMQDVRMGEINCIIVKDLSRFGRNYLEAGNYIEKIFPFFGVRFVAVADGYDTGMGGSETGQIASEIKNLVNDMYAKDFSVKAKMSLDSRRKAGSYVGGLPPYGYTVAWEGKIRKLLPDENTAEIVRFIYRKFVETENYAFVSDELNRRRINPPAIYQKTGEVYCQQEENFKGWDRGAIERIIKNTTYLGNLVQGKTTITARDEKNRIRRSQEEWIIKEQWHEPLIDKKTAALAQEVVQKICRRTESHRHPTEGCPMDENMYDGLLYCGVCGRKMTRHSYVKNYVDGNRARMGGYFCVNGGATKVDVSPASNRISKRELTEVLFFQLHSEFAMHMKKQREYVEKARRIIERNKAEKEKELHKLQLAVRKLDEEESQRYVEYRSGKLPQKQYVSYKMSREEKMQELARGEERCQRELKILEKEGDGYLKAVRSLIRFQSEKILTRDLLDTLIERIYVYPGKRIEVLFAYGDPFVGKGR